MQTYHDYHDILNRKDRVDGIIPITILQNSWASFISKTSTTIDWFQQWNGEQSTSNLKFKIFTMRQITYVQQFDCYYKFEDIIIFFTILLLIMNYEFAK